MTATSLILMVLVQGAVTFLTAYFFWRVLKTPAKPEPDSYENE